MPKSQDFIFEEKPSLTSGGLIPAAEPRPSGGAGGGSAAGPGVPRGVCATGEKSRPGTRAPAGLARPQGRTVLLPSASPCPGAHQPGTWCHPSLPAPFAGAGGGQRRPQPLPALPPPLRAAPRCSAARDQASCCCRCRSASEPGLSPAAPLQSQGAILPSPRPRSLLAAAHNLTPSRARNAVLPGAWRIQERDLGECACFYTSDIF